MADLKQQVIAIYQSLEDFLRSKDFEEDLRKVLEKSNPGYIDVLEKRRRDIERSDHGIVIAGETSSGKTSLINKILEKKFSRVRIQESTSTVCKIRNSEKIRIILEHESGDTEVKDLTDSCDLKTKEGRKQFRKKLDELTNMTGRSTQYRSVDIGFPIPFLKGNVILVDTPGIGGSGQVTHKLMDYLPNALSFIFVINVASAGGMQRDRLPEILRSISALKIEGEMPSFDPRDVIFITNKWDLIARKETDSEESEDTEEEDEEKSMWENIQSEIKSKWPTVADRNIFKMSLNKVAPNKTNHSVEQFQEFKKVLMSNIEKAENARVREHLGFLEALFKDVTIDLQSRLKVKEKSAELQENKARKHQKEIQELKKRYKQKEEELENRITAHIENTANEIYKEVNTPSGKQLILELGRKPILDTCNEPEQCVKEVQRRFNKYIESFLNSEKVMKEFKDIRDDAISFNKEINLKLYQMENQWATGSNDDNQTEELSGIEFFAGVVLAPIWLLLVAVGEVVVTLIKTPSAVWSLFTGKAKKNQHAIDKTYDECKSSVHRDVRDQLKKNTGAVLNKLVKKMTVDEPSKRTEALDERIQQLIKHRQEILSKQDLLLNLARKIKLMDENISKLQKYLKPIESHLEEQNIN